MAIDYSSRVEQTLLKSQSYQKDQAALSPEAIAYVLVSMWDAKNDRHAILRDPINDYVIPDGRAPHTGTAEFRHLPGGIGNQPI